MINPLSCPSSENVLISLLHDVLGSQFFSFHTRSPLITLQQGKDLHHSVARQGQKLGLLRLSPMAMENLGVRGAWYQLTEMEVPDALMAFSDITTVGVTEVSHYNHVR